MEIARDACRNIELVSFHRADDKKIVEWTLPIEKNETISPTNDRKGKSRRKNGIDENGIIDDQFMNNCIYLIGYNKIWLNEL